EDAAMTAPADEAPDVGLGPGRGSGKEPGATGRGVVPVWSASGMRRRACMELASVAAVVLAVTAYVQLAPGPGGRGRSPVRSPPAPPRPAPAPPPPSPDAGSSGAAVPEAAPSPPEPESGPVVLESPATPPAPPPVPDRAKLAAAEKALDAASGDRARADARAADAAHRMGAAAHRA